jgi:membrane-bound metal-dependent hydrolase YbcI (DUF457 family)
MTSNGHRITAFSFAALSVATLLSKPDLLHYNTITSYAWLAIFVMCMLIGANAPDYLELPRYEKNPYGRDKRITIIPHRTFTHWPVPWIAAIYVTIITPMMWYYQAAALGFLISGLLHLAMDTFSKSGIPILLPFKRYSMKIPLYKTGKSSEVVVVIIIMSLFCGVAYWLATGLIFSFSP